MKEAFNFQPGMILKFKYDGSMGRTRIKLSAGKYLQMHIITNISTVAKLSLLHTL